ncbi:MAG: hypothetical protein GTO03_18590, partial [Planctomycetales bacterium]|nr:hypothetical protein [Planctomycetales bacterium]
GGRPASGLTAVGGVRRSRWASWQGALLVFGCCALLLAGCDLFEEMDPTKPKPRPRKTVQPQPVEVAPPKPPAPPPRFIELNVGGQKRTLSSCYLKLVPSTSRTPAVLMVTSYRSAQDESYPSFFMRVVLVGDDLNALLGQPMQARIFFAAAPNDVVLYTPDAEPAMVTIRNTDDTGRVLGTIINARLLNTANDESLPITGQFDGVLE